MVESDARIEQLMGMLKTLTTDVSDSRRVLTQQNTEMKQQNMIMNQQIQTQLTDMQTAFDSRVKAVEESSARHEAAIADIRKILEDLQRNQSTRAASSAPPASSTSSSSVFASTPGSTKRYKIGSPREDMDEGAYRKNVAWVRGFQHPLIRSFLVDYGKKLLQDYTPSLVRDSCKIKADNVRKFFTIEFPDESSCRNFLERTRDADLTFIDPRETAPAKITVRPDQSASHLRMGQACGRMYSSLATFLKDCSEWPKTAKLGVNKARGLLYGYDGHLIWVFFHIKANGDSFTITEGADLPFFGINPEMAQQWIAAALSSPFR